MKLTEDRGVKIYVKDRPTSSGGTFRTYSMGVASKDKDGNWVNGFLDCLFKKDDASKITNKCKIKINNAFPTVSEYQDRKYVKWFINDFEVIEQGEAVGDTSNPLAGVEDFMTISDAEFETELPFA